MKRPLIILFVLCLFSCKKESDIGLKLDSFQFNRIPSSHSGLNFSNAIKEDQNYNHLVWESIFYGGGVAIGDINNDGLDDVFLTGNQVNDKLFLNKGNLNFEDITQQANINKDENTWSSGVTMADVNNDGWLDIYVSRSWWQRDHKGKTKRKNKLYINQKDGRFLEQAENYGLADSGYSTQASFADFDKDGDLDMFLINCPSNNIDQKLDYIQKNKIPFEFSNKLYINMDSKFVDQTKQSGLEDYGFGLGVVTLDLNDDGWTDIYVSNDFEQADRYYINQKDGSFKDEIKSKLKHISYSSMGVDVGDFNNDGLKDIFVLDMQSASHYRSKTTMPSMSVENFWKNVVRGNHYQYMTNMLQMNNGEGFYSEIAHLAGVNSSDWSWATLMADFDNDGYKDLFVTNGVDRDLKNNDYLEMLRVNKKEGADLLALSQKAPSNKITNCFYHNQGNLKFKNIAGEIGLQAKGFSYGAAYGDLDNDGDLDLITCNNNEEVALYENQNANHFIGFDFSTFPHNGLNTKIKIWVDGMIQSKEITATRGYQSSVSTKAIFGVSQKKKVDSLLIVLPNGQELFKTELTTDSIYQWNMQDFNDPISRKKEGHSLLAMSSSDYGFNYIHEENLYDDFKIQSLLPHRQSTQGPALCVADVNGDGLEDIFIGGARGDADILYLQNKRGAFDVSQIFKPDQNYESVAALFFDVNMDGFQDLYVVSGGSDLPVSNPLYQDRLYINNGKGQFQRDLTFVPQAINGSSVAVEDMDRDGDLDLFVGGADRPLSYPRSEPFSVYRNDEGKLTEIQSKTFNSLGIIRSIIWVDLNGDGFKDVLPVGEWSDINYLPNDNGKGFLDPVSIADKELKGWWNSIEKVDINDDGKPDFVLGNIGTNNKFGVDNQHRLKIYGNDFDKNSSYDVVLSKNYKDKAVPLRGRECSSEKMPFIKRKFKDYHSFASASLVDIYGEKNLNESTQYEVNEFRSGTLISNSNSYEFHPFPNEAQLSAVKASYTQDLNKDGLKDVVLVGNHFGAEVETVRHDALNGLVLLNSKNGFRALSSQESGVYVPANARKLLPIQIGKSKKLIVGNNNSRQLFIELDHR